MSADDSRPREAILNLEEAARAAGVSPSTLRRHRDVLRQYGAEIGPRWAVPISALQASGLMKPRTPPDQPASAPSSTDAPTEDDVHERIRELERDALEQRHRAEIAELRRRAEVAEALADERGRMVEILSQKMLTAGPATTAPETAAQSAPGTPEHPGPERPTPEHTAPQQSRWRRWITTREPNR